MSYFIMAGKKTVTLFRGNRRLWLVFIYLQWTRRWEGDNISAIHREIGWRNRETDEGLHVIKWTLFVTLLFLCGTWG